MMKQPETCAAVFRLQTECWRLSFGAGHCLLKRKVLLTLPLCVSQGTGAELQLSVDSFKVVEAKSQEEAPDCQKMVNKVSCYWVCMVKV
jgi:hypothetical protein